MPGCERFDVIAPDTFEAVVSLGIASVKGRYSGQVRITERDEPNQYTLSVEGSGSSGTVRGTGTIALAPAPDGTAIHWSADVQMGGPIASLGQRLFGGVTKLVASDFFKSMDGWIAQKPATS